MAGLTGVRADELAALEAFAGCPIDHLAPLAARLRPLSAEPGQVLMQQGELAVSFLLIGSGAAEVTHTGVDGHDAVAHVHSGLILGEIALLRDTSRTATVVATERLTGWVGDREAFATLLEIPGMLDKLVRTARQRLAAFITPVPLRMRDDTWFYLRPVLPGDSERTTNGPVEFSSETLYRRFQTPRTPTKSLMTYLFEVDYVHHFVWVMTDGAEGPVVADARYVREEADPSVAEVAFIVGDDYQGRGIGTVLMEALVVAARDSGVERFTARVLTENRAMRTILNRLGAVWDRDEPGVVTTVVDVPELKDLQLEPHSIRRIRDVFRQVTRAVD